ncbi:hypothetical protein [Arthrobacter sp. ISL-95]|uniref:hypothetical protein n=1 Tax=Arthrobacter sp. ISL-95 TaxID=2819116 RepID=UPI001BEAD3BC|nr:hypothetical protein [Arthrobacter sp. ISL-95]MBT2587972.1 hypothetical protein [Arthrobacter sp. ISL-95]
MNYKQVAGCLREYGSALRGSWGDIDGRSEQMSLNVLAMAIDNPIGFDVLSMREALGVCPAGHGHWTEFCAEECA